MCNYGYDVKSRMDIKVVKQYGSTVAWAIQSVIVMCSGTKRLAREMRVSP